ncbi:mRNA-decapping enzyme subunit 2 [Mortierella antarctica]|nr:mRNA-decapping enzyme subunit 2 [Mortierella antarctica]
MSWTNASFENILDDLSSRFILNVPDEELLSVERILFQIEQAHWFYEDFIREQNSSLPSFSLKNFSAKYILFRVHCPLLNEWANEHETAFANFMEYKFRVPVCGAIILNETMDKCILVKGWAARSGWGFPKGKINKDEQDSLCAAREVWEETGFDITEYIKDEDYVEQTMKDQRVRLYIIKGVPESTVFEPQTRKEISKIEWHKLTDLPTARPKHVDRGAHSGRESGSEKPNNPNAKNPSRYYMVIPFVQKLKHWVATQKKMAKRKGSGQAGQRQQESPELHITSGAHHHHHRHSTGTVVTSNEAKLDSDLLKSMLGIGIGNKTEPSHQSGSTPTLHHTQISSSQSTSLPGATDAQQSSQMLMSLLGIQKAPQQSPSLQPSTLAPNRGPQPQTQHQRPQQQPQQNGSDAIKAMLGISLGNNTNGSPQLMPANRNMNQHPHYSPQMGHQQHYLSSPAMANQPHHPPQNMGSPMFANGRKSSVDLLTLLNSGNGGGGGLGGGGGNANGGSPLMYRQEAWNGQNRPGSYGGIPTYQHQQQYPYQQPQHQQYAPGPAFDQGLQKPKQTSPHTSKSNSMQQFQFDLNALV